MASIGRPPPAPGTLLRGRRALVVEASRRVRLMLREVVSGFGPDQVAHGPAGHILHHQIEQAVVIALVEHRDHVGMGQSCGRPSFALESPSELFVITHARMHDLDRNGAVQAGVAGLIDRRHSAAGNPAADQVAAVEQATDEGVVAPISGCLRHVSTFRACRGGRVAATQRSL